MIKISSVKNLWSELLAHCRPEDTTFGGNKIKSATPEQEASHLIDEGNVLEDAGRLEEAMQRYESAIRLAPTLARAHLNHGNILLAQDQAEAALDAYAAALSIDPDYASAQYNLGNANARLGRHKAAQDAYRAALKLKPEFVDAEVALGCVQEDLGQLEEAAASYRRALEIQPDYAEVHGNLGKVLLALERFDDAVSSFRRALEIMSDSAEMHFELGRALTKKGEFEDAVASFRRVLELDSSSVAAHINLGIALSELGQFDAAVSNYNLALEIDPSSVMALINLGAALKKRGKFDAAVASYHRALEVDPDSVMALNNLGNVLKDLGRFDAAVTNYHRALEIKPDFAEAHANLGGIYYERGKLDAAAASYRHALEINPDFAMAHSNLGVVLKDLGQLEDAIESCRRALGIDIELIEAQDALLFTHNCLVDQPASVMLDDAKRYGEVVARKARPYNSWRNTREPGRCLHVGLVSGDLCNHPVGFFVESVLTALKTQASDRLRLFAYPSYYRFDEVSERIKASCEGWYSAVGMSDESLAHRIREDRIDILIDLSGHTGHNRLPMFAWKPAPVQVSWLGYFATTGVAAMDYLIADPWTLPETEEVNFTEKIWRLPETRLCFTPPEVNVEVSLLPMLTNGHITFGCFNHLAKMNDAVVALWARVLKAVPGSRLLLKAKQLDEESVRQSVVGRFGAHGVSADRLMMEGLDTRSKYLMAYHKVDIALDPFPYPGGTTTVEGLWMGVPVLTLAGERFLSRQGVGLLMNSGLSDWVASDPEDYVNRAISHAGNWQDLAVLRERLRHQVLASAIFDAPRFAHYFEDSLRGMWKKWCEQQDD